MSQVFPSYFQNPGLLLIKTHNYILISKTCTAYSEATCETKCLLWSFAELPLRHSCSSRASSQSEHGLTVSGNDYLKQSFTLLKVREKINSETIPFFKKNRRTRNTFLKECWMTLRASYSQLSSPCTVWRLNCLFWEILVAAGKCSHNLAIWHT